MNKKILIVGHGCIGTSLLHQDLIKSVHQFHPELEVVVVTPEEAQKELGMTFAQQAEPIKYEAPVIHTPHYFRPPVTRRERREKARNSI